MSERADIHFADDPDAVEQYVLRRMDPEDLQLCDDHIRTCEKCAAIVRIEMEMAAGVRRGARNELKARLSRRVEVTAESRTPWTRIAAAAAVIVMMLGVGYLSGWFQLHKEEKPSLTTETVENQPNAEQSPAKSDQLAEKSRSSGKAAKSTTGEEVHTRVEKNIDLAASELRQQSEQGRSGDQPQIVLKAEEHLATGGSEPLRVPQPAAAAPAGAVPLTTQIWTVGEVYIAESESELKQREYQAKDCAQARSVRRAPTTAPSVEKKDKSVIPTRHFIVDQQPSSSLPPSQQKPPSQGGNRIPVLLEDKDGTILIVLFVDPPLSSSSLQRARVSEAGDDSLVVLLPGRSIAFEIPPSFRASRARQ